MGPGLWADGISLSCASSLVQGNTVTDATDGGIVIFGSPGSTITGNTITASTQTLMGGINIVGASLLWHAITDSADVYPWRNSSVRVTKNNIRCALRELRSSADCAGPRTR